MTAPQSSLRRILTFWPLLFYGLGVIVGAGIYVAIGTVIARAGDTAPVAFLLAGITAAMTGLCYAELASRFPEAAGSVVYVKHAFGSETLARLTGLPLTAAVAISAASIALGAITYLTILLPWPPELLLPLLIVGCTAIAAYGVGESVWLAAAIGILEIGGLIVATIAGVIAAPELHFRTMLPVDLAGWGTYGLRRLHRVLCVHRLRDSGQPGRGDEGSRIAPCRAALSAPSRSASCSTWRSPPPPYSVTVARTIRCSTSSRAPEPGCSHASVSSPSAMAHWSRS